MTITFDTDDERIVRQKLEEEGVSVTALRIQNVLYNVRAAFLQQFDEEADHMINEFEAEAA
jgi:aspartate/methionine/tyrosine aminotransferase